VAISRDGGATWDRPVHIGPSTTPNGFLEAPDGALYLLTLGSTDAGRDFRVWVSSDRGVTWNPTVVGPFVIPPGYNDQNRWVDQRPWTTMPDMTLRASDGHLFAVAQSWDETQESYRIHLHRSADGAATFQAVPTPTFESSTCPDCHVTKPTVTVDAAGRLGLQVQLTVDGATRKEVWFAASADDGATWTQPVLLSATDVPSFWAHPMDLTPQPSSLVATATYLAENPTDAHGVAVGVGLSTLVSELQLRWNGEYWQITSSPHGFVALYIEHSADGIPELWSRVVAPKADAAGTT